MIEFRMPSLGADMEDGKLTEWRVKSGDVVKRGDIVAEVETQKGIIEIEIFEEGKIDQLLIQIGDKVKVGTVIATLISSGEQAEEKTEIKPSPVKITTAPATEKTLPSAPALRIKASPLAKKIAVENNIDLTLIQGTGEGGAITKEDVEKAIATKEVLKKEAPVASTENIRLAIAAAMSKSNREIPHYYLETKIDMSQALGWIAEANKQRPVKKRLLPVALIMKAIAKSLMEVPQLNATWENGLLMKKEIHIGFAVSLRGGGVIIPAIHDADKKSVDEMMEAFNDIIPRARALKLRSSELSDSTITVTNLGEGGAEKVYGVIYPPQVAIIGLGSITEQPWAENGMLDVRPVLYATLAGDHRATDGHTGSRFLVALKNHLQKPAEL